MPSIDLSLLTRRCLCGLLGTLVLSSSLWGVTFVGYDPAIHERYIAGAPNPDFLLDEAKITGISGQPLQTFNRAHLISPFHIVTSRHTGQPEVRYRKSDGTFATYSVTSGAASVANPNGYVDLTTHLGGGLTAVSDIRLYRLAAPISAADGITPMPIFEGDAIDIVGQEIYVMGKDNRAGRNTVRDVVLAETSGGVVKTYTTSHTFDTNPADLLYDGVGADETKLVSGDSGHATLIKIGSTVGLVGMNLGIDPDGTLYEGLYTNFNSILAPYLPEIRSIVTSDGYSISTISVVPEPGSLAGILCLTTGLVCCRRRRQ
jgi:hypothetical protein